MTPSSELFRGRALVLGSLGVLDVNFGDY
jgi:hypothetical protein